MDRDLSFLRALWQVDQGLQALSKQMESTLGVTAPQRLVIRVIGAHAGVSAGQIAEEVGLHPSATSSILRRLEARRRVTRSADPDDRRRALFQLTESGRAIDRIRTGTVEGIIAGLLRREDDTDVAIAASLLGRLGGELHTAAARP